MAVAFGDDAALWIPDFLGLLAGMPTRCRGGGGGTGPSVPCAAHPVRFPGRGESGGHFEPRLGLARCLGLPALMSPPGGIRLGSREFRRPVGPGRKCKAGRLAAKRAGERSCVGLVSPAPSQGFAAGWFGYRFRGPEPAPPSPLGKAGPRPQLAFCILRPGASGYQF